MLIRIPLSIVISSEMSRHKFHHVVHVQEHWLANLYLFLNLKVAEKDTNLHWLKKIARDRNVLPCMLSIILFFCN
jgi:hypothetical protein